jgi:hypothetical protein
LKQISFTDQLGTEHTFETSPKRIIVPSQTELLHDLGLEARMVELLNFVYPYHLKSTKTIVGGTKVNYRIKLGTAT